MIPITEKVSNAINRYQKTFRYRISMADISKYHSPKEFEVHINSMIGRKNPELGGTIIQKGGKRHELFRGNNLNL
ncbi:MAG: hypothetical protein IKG47_04515 [Oscillospiraceae bacterium]|nr:hypothetical protein [Oscillospiraceae bacterium]